MDKDAEHKGICQHCSKYEPKFQKKYLNRKKEEIDKARKLIINDYD